MPPEGGTGIPARELLADKNVRPTVRVVIASDSKRGHENQSRVLARMLGDTEPLIMRLRSPEGGFAERLLRARFALFGPQSLSQSQAAALVKQHLKPESPEEFRDFATDIGKHRADYRVFTVSTGTPPATMNLLLARLLGAEPLCVMRPSMLPRKLFKLLVVPEHDVGERGGLGTEGLPRRILPFPIALSYHDQQSARFAAAELTKEANLPSESRYWTVAIGGPSKSAEWNQTTFEREFKNLIKQAGENGVRLLITTSRRSPSEAVKFVKEVSGDTLAFLLDAAHDKRNPLPAFYELSEAVVVTADSFSMVCEAIQAGFKPYLLRAEQLSRKLRFGLLILEHDLHAICWSSNSQPGQLEIPIGRSEPNQYFQKLQSEVRSRLKLD